MIEKLSASWRSYREKRRRYQIERALYKAAGHRDAGHGGFEGEAQHRPDDLSRITGGAGGP